jgi:hypothetical protein
LCVLKIYKFNRMLKYSIPPVLLAACVLRALPSSVSRRHSTNVVSKASAEVRIYIILNLISLTNAQDRTENDTFILITNYITN